MVYIIHDISKDFIAKIATDQILLTCSRHQSLQIFEFQFSKSLFLFIEGGQENIFHWSKKYFRPIKNVSINKKQRFGELEFEYLETLMS